MPSDYVHYVNVRASDDVKTSTSRNTLNYVSSDISSFMLKLSTRVLPSRLAPLLRLVPLRTIGFFFPLIVVDFLISFRTSVFTRFEIDPPRYAGHLGEGFQSDDGV